MAKVPLRIVGIGRDIELRVVSFLTRARQATEYVAFIDLGSEDETAILAAGKELQHNEDLLLSKEFRGSEIESLSIVISGDTSEMAPGITSLNGCDLLIHEATFLDDFSQHADDYLHSTASGAARTAIACGAKHLVLTHYGARIKQTDESLSEAKSVLAESKTTLSAARDGDRILIENPNEITHLYWRNDGWFRCLIKAFI